MIEGTDGRSGNGSPPHHARFPRVKIPQGTPTGGVDLARLINSTTPLAWFEAVAIVQELCHVLQAVRRGGADGDLEPEDVAITPQGSVEVRGGLDEELPDVTKVAHLLLTLLEEAPGLPVQLRLLALEAAAPSPTRLSLRDWSARLAAFERPSRDRTIREVYERFTQLPAREAPPRTVARARAASVAAGRHWWKDRRLRRAAAAVVVLAGAWLGGSWLWQEAGSMLFGGREGANAESSGPTDADQSLSAAAAARIRAAAFRIWGPAAVRPAPPDLDVALAGQPIVVVVPTVLPVVSASETAELMLASTAPPAVRPAKVDTALYSAADAAVVPPALVRPRLPTRPTTGTREQDLPQVEVLVSPAGEVESVKLLTQPASVASAMMLSAIKTWRFGPAVHDGQPVRYRLLLRLTNE